MAAMACYDSYGNYPGFADVLRVLRPDTRIILDVGNGWYGKNLTPGEQRIARLLDPAKKKTL